MSKIRIGTRGSDLALFQTNQVAQALKKTDPSLTVEIIEVKTLGDKKQGTERAAFGDKKDWVYELEMALLDKSIDVAVHSAKDVPGNTEPGLSLLAVLERAQPFDIFIGRKKTDGTRILFKDALALPTALIGTASLRRKAALKHSFPTFQFIDHRGNVPTRINKLDADESLTGIILAEAGVTRLGILKESEFERIPLASCLPAMNQGILAVQFRSEDKTCRNYLEKLSPAPLQAIFDAERQMAELLEGDCNSAVGIHAYPDRNQYTLRVEIYARDGSACVKAERTFTNDTKVVSLETMLNELTELGGLQLLK